MTFSADESSIEDSLPREGFEIQHGAERYRLASGSRNILIGSNLYVAFPVGRSEYGVAFVGGSGQNELSIRLPLSHPFTKRYFQNGIPPKKITVTARRKQVRSGQVERFWFGEITSCSVEDHVALFRAPALSADAIDRQVPNFTVGRLCPYILYESSCDVARSGFRVITTVTNVNGPKITVASMGGNPSEWAQFGELVHVASGERMTIFEQVGNLITMQLQIAEVRTGDVVHVFAGCDHTVATCFSKFNNVSNFGGAPLLPRGSLFVPNGYGVVSQE